MRDAFATVATTSSFVIQRATRSVLPGAKKAVFSHPLPNCGVEGWMNDPFRRNLLTSVHESRSLSKYLRMGA
ncbi:hypothetical protein EYZ11_001801 [Aspergillus tanneri]|uniref:Uncharacterized protein n=1 Tax=Aspergillus tanneri TaxID=1220188 RepID=A0A4S3JTN5_9EURO|nr:hypothetical protein EYZ11_001801 [Aspergillus tanneri]